MIQIEKVAEELFDKIRSRFSPVNIGDETLKSTDNPKDARFFNFDFESAGEKYGNITIGIVDDDTLKVIYDKDIAREMPEHVRHEWYDFVRGIRKFSKRNRIDKFDVRDIAKSGLNIKDLKSLVSGTDVKTSNEIEHVTESKLSKPFGTSRNTYQTLDNVRIVARHKNRIVDETKPGARSRNIEAFYIENSQGERFRCPEGTTFNGARAIARHVKNGGNLYDDFGQHIIKMIAEMNNLRTFVRKMRGRQFEDVETSHMVEAAIDHYGKLHRDIFTLRGQRGYEQYRTLWQPEVIDEELIDIDELKERFVKRVFDDRLTAALPVVYHAYKTRKDEIGEEFEAWANGILEAGDDNPIDIENKRHANMDLDLDEDNDNGEFSPFANSVGIRDSDMNAIDGDSQDEKLAQLLNQHGFEWRFTDGVYYFESREELERAKDIIAQKEANSGENVEFPKMAVFDPATGVYGASKNDREIGGYSNGVMEELSLLKQLSGIK